MLRREHFTNEEIKLLLAGRHTKWQQAGLEYRRSYPWVTRWTCDRIDDAVIQWASENGRWPLSREFHQANRLPSHSVFYHHSVPTHVCWNEHREWWKAERERRRKGEKNRSFPYSEKRHLDFWARIVKRAPEIPAKLLLAIPNQTHRRDAILAGGGFERILREGAGRQMQADDYGTLWRLDFAEPNTNDWYSLFVEVVNSTPQLDAKGKPKLGRDGKPIYDHYFLRVPPMTRTAREAVAWTGHFEPERSDRNQTPMLGPREFAGFVAQS